MSYIKEKLTKECPFSSAWNDLDSKGRSSIEMGYGRMDYDGHMWWRTFFRVNEALETPERIAELEAVCDAMTDAFPNLFSLEKFVAANGEKQNEVEYNLYLIGNASDYWIRAITVPRNYNLYVHAICTDKRKDGLNDYE